MTHTESVGCVVSEVVCESTLLSDLIGWVMPHLQFVSHYRKRNIDNNIIVIQVMILLCIVELLYKENKESRKRK